MSTLDTAQAQSKLEAVRTAMATVLVGQHELVDHLLLALLADGHALVEGVPGLAKTLSISTLQSVLILASPECSSRRISCRAI